MDYVKGPYVVDTDKHRLDILVIHDFLRCSYWAKGIPMAVVTRSIENSLCFGLYADKRQVGFARVITDLSTFAYLADVFVLEEYRGRGLGRWLVECIMAHPGLQGLRRWLLVTRDAHGLYEEFGFGALASPERYLELTHLDVYQAQSR